MHAALPEIPNAFSQCLAGDPLDGRFRRGVDIQHVDYVGLVKALRELVHQMLRARVAVRLEHSVNAAKLAELRGGECSPNLSGMMAVVVDHGDAAGLATHLKAAVDP